MAYRFWLQCSVAVTLALASVNAGQCQTEIPPITFTGPLSLLKPGDCQASICKVYSLAELGSDANLCKWVAETIPQMVQPGTWSNADGKQKLSYFAPAKVLVINHTPAVHGQIDEFLQSLKKTMPQVRAPQRDEPIQQAQFAVPDRVPSPMPSTQAYPVPAAPALPKHLFHFIIRYEGDGIIDANVVKFARAMNQENKSSLGNLPSSTVVPAPAVYAIPAAGMTPLAPPMPSSINGMVPSQNCVPPSTPRPVMPPADAPPSPGLTEWMQIFSFIAF
jgi:hypothetical protein